MDCLQSKLKGGVTLAKPMMLLSGLIVMFALPLQGIARPTLRTVTQTEGDAVVTLTLENQFIEDDLRVPCEVSITVDGERRPLEVGDTILLSVKEDDAIGDDLIFEVEEVIDSVAESAQLFTRTYDCTFPAMDDLLGNLEVFAKLEVDKQDCGNLCELSFGEDTPATPTVIMRKVTDDRDDNEDGDDTNLDAVPFTDRLLSDRVARDSDWLTLSYPYPVELLARLESYLIGGDLELKLYDQALNLIAEASPEEGGTSKSLRPNSALIEGIYYLEITPTDPTDYNFYDLFVLESQVMTECIAGTLEERPCGLCGREERSCTAGGEWGAWSACIGSGVCEPGAEESEGCEEGGSRNRVCSTSCTWEPFSECIECEEDTVESCFTGPQEAAGIGACVEGTRTCSRGQWSSCQGDELPRPELCQDGIDNDCNGLSDVNDPACLAQLGEACAGDGCIELLSCLQDGFPGGYCGGRDCDRCVPGSICGTHRSQTYCLKPCLGNPDCRDGYFCSEAGLAGQKVCVPRCTQDSDCESGQECGLEGQCESAAQIGDACDGNMSCRAPLQCLPTPFVDGYCGTVGCSNCPSESACGQVRGQLYCLALCSPGSCREGYQCASAGRSGEMVCIPGCLGDQDCNTGERCTVQGLCEPMMALPGEGCGTGPACGLGYVCAFVNMVQSCIPSCSSDEVCGAGYRCGEDQYCIAVGSPEPSVSVKTDEGCQQDNARVSSLLLWLLLFLIPINRQRLRSI